MIPMADPTTQVDEDNCSFRSGNKTLNPLMMPISKHRAIVTTNKTNHDRMFPMLRSISSTMITDEIATML